MFKIKKITSPSQSLPRHPNSTPPLPFLSPLSILYQNLSSAVPFHPSPALNTLYITSPPQPLPRHPRQAPPLHDPPYSTLPLSTVPFRPSPTTLNFPSQAPPFSPLPSLPSSPSGRVLSRPQVNRCQAWQSLWARRSRHEHATPALRFLPSRRAHYLSALSHARTQASDQDAALNPLRPL